MRRSRWTRKGSRTRTTLWKDTTSRLLHPRNERRINGFTAVYRDNGLNFSDEQIVKLPEMRPHVTEGKDIIQYLITKGMEFDGIFAISDGRAIGSYMGLQKMEKRIPQDKN